MGPRAPVIALSHLKNELRAMGHTDADNSIIMELLQDMQLEDIVFDDAATRIGKERARWDRLDQG